MNVLVPGNQRMRGKWYSVRFKMPEGNYNSSLDSKNEIELRFDGVDADATSGKFNLKVEPIDSKRKKEDVVAGILRDYQEGIARRLKGMTPSDRTSKEPRMKIEEVTHGEFIGYAGRGDPDFPNSVSITTTNGEFVVSANLRLNSDRRLPQTLVQLDDIVKILATLEIQKL